MLFYFLEPTLALKLSHDFGYSPSLIGLCMLLFFCAIAVGNFISLNLGNSIEKRWVIIGGDLTMVAGLVCVGPSRLLRLPDSPYLVISGLCIGGFGRGLIDGLPPQTQ